MRTRFEFRRGPLLSASVGILACAFGLMAAALGGPSVWSYAVLHDHFIPLDAGWRMASGEIPHVDFHSPVGPAYLAAAWAGTEIAGRSPKALVWMNLLFAAAAAPWILWAAFKSLRPLAAACAGVSLVLLALSPGALDLPGGFVDWVAMYNRWGWTAFGLAGLILSSPEPKEAEEGFGRRAWIEGVSAGAAIFLAACVKIPFGAFAFIGAAACAALFPDGRRRRALWALAVPAVLGLGLLLHPVGRGYAEDVLMAARAARGVAPLLGPSAIWEANAGVLALFLAAALAYGRAAGAPSRERPPGPPSSERPPGPPSSERPAGAPPCGGSIVGPPPGSAAVLDGRKISAAAAWILLCFAAALQCGQAAMAAAPILAFVLLDGTAALSGRKEAWRRAASAAAAILLLLPAARDFESIRAAAMGSKEAEEAFGLSISDLPSGRNQAFERAEAQDRPGAPSGAPSNGLAWSGGSYRNGSARTPTAARTLNPHEYLRSLRRGAALAAGFVKPGDRIQAADFVDPFPWILGFPPPKGDLLWRHDGRTWSKDSAPDAAEEEAGMDFLLVPAFSFDPARSDAWIDAHLRRLREGWEVAGETPLWTLLRKKAAVPSSAGTGGTP